MERLFLVLLVSISIFACTKKAEPVPPDPIVGKWTIHHVVYSQFAKPLDSYNRVDSSAAIGTDTYIFKSDGSYSETYSGYDFYSVDQQNLSSGTEKGTWTYAPDVKPSPLLLLSRTSPVGPLYYPVFTSKSEFKASYTRPYLLNGSELRYAEEIYYRKK